MDGNQFDRITRAMAGGATRRGVLRGFVGGVGALVAAAVGRSGGVEAQTQAQCGNKSCRTDPGVCSNGCVCCVYPNNTSRCQPANSCKSGTIVSTTTTAAPFYCSVNEDCPSGFSCFQGICTPSSPTGFVFNVPAAKVWETLTDADTLTALGIPSDIAPVVGHRFQFRPVAGAGSNTLIDAEVVEIETLSRFSFNWLNAPNGKPITVTVTLTPEQAGAATRIRLTQTDLSGESCRASARVLGANWGQRLFKEALPTHFAKSE